MSCSVIVWVHNVELRRLRGFSRRSPRTQGYAAWVSRARRYKQWRRRPSPSGTCGCSKVPDSRMPRRSITARDLRLPTAAKETISFNPSEWKPTRRASFAASVASPLPHCEDARRHPTSTQGENGSSADGVCKPTNPMNSWVALHSAAQKPHPRSSMSNWQRSAIASLSVRVSVAGKYSMTRGSAFIAAKGSRSASLHWRKQRLSVSTSISSAIRYSAR